MVQNNTEVDSDPWVQTDSLHVAAHLILLSHTKRKVPELLICHVMCAVW